MRKILSIALVLAGAFLFAPIASAQFTTVTATVKDPNGIPYAGAVLNAVLVPSTGGGYTLSGQPYSGRIGPVTLDASGSFTVNFGDVTLITPGSPQWQITIDSAAATIALSLGTGPQTFTFTSTGTTISGSSPVSLTTALNALAPKLTNFAGAGTGTIAGTVSATHIPYASAANTLSDIAGSAVTGATGAIALTAGADTTKPLAIASHSATQSVTLFDVNNQSSVSADTPVTIRGLGLGSFTPAASLAELHIAGESGTTSGYGWVLTNHTADVAKGTANLTLLEGKVNDTGVPELCGGDGPNDGGNNYGCLLWGNPVSTGGETIIARTACTNCVTTIVPFAVEGAVGQTADLFDSLNSSAVVLSGLDSIGSLFFNGSSSGTAKIGVAAAAGSPCKILLPVTSPTVGQVLSSAAPSGGNCQTSWAAAGGGVTSFSGDGTIITNSASTGAVTATIAGTSGGVPYFNSATSWTSSAALASGGVLLGGGAGAAPNTSTQLTFSAPTLTVGLAGTSSGILSLTGSSSGNSTFTANAVAGTSTNAVVMSNVLNGPNGTAAAPTYSVGNTNTGLCNCGLGAGKIGFSANGASNISLGVATSGSIQIVDSDAFLWGSTSSGGQDAGLSRVATGIVGVGNGTVGNANADIAYGTASTSSVTASNPTINTDTNLIQLSPIAGYFNRAANTYVIQAAGNYTTTAASSPVLTFKLLLCTVSGCGSGTVVTLVNIVTTALSATALTNATWTLSVTCVTNTAGASGNLVCKGSPGLTLDTGATLITPDSTFVDANTATSSNINLTSALFLQATVAQSVAGASNSYVQTLASLR